MGIAAKTGNSVFRDSRHAVHAMLLSIAAVSLLLTTAGAHGWIRELTAAITFTFLPGAALLALLPDVGKLLRLGLAAVLSLTVLAFGGFILVEIGAFHPRLLIWTIFPLSAALLIWREFTGAGDRWGVRHAGAIARTTPETSLEERTRANILMAWRAATERSANRWALIVLVLAMGTWLVSVQGVDFLSMNGYGLRSVLPTSWTIAFVLILGTIALYAASSRPIAWVMFSLVAGAIVMIYATPALVYDAPHLPWVYKHVGVAELFLDTGHAQRNVDIYNRWPAAFAMGGTYSRFAGVADATYWVQWAELYFIGLQASLVGAITWNETKRASTAGLATLFFVLINWVGQAYYSPQAIALTMMLGLFAVVFTQLYDGGNRLGRWLSKLVSSITRQQQEWPDGSAPVEWSRRTAAVVAMALMAGVTMVHQLTPYVLLLQLGTLTFAGFVRPRWLFWACLTITIAYLLPNLAWVNEHFGLFSSFDPFNNVKRPGSNTTLYECKNACKVVFSVSMLAAVVAWLGAMAAIITIARRLPSFRLPLYGLSLFAPFLILLGQNYGGEAGVRVIMFTSPFAAILIAAGITATRGTVRLVLCILTVFILANGFSYAYFGSEQSRFVTRDEVRSAQYLYANAPKESMIIEAAPNYPVLTAGNYFDFKSGADGLFGDVRLLNKPLGPAQVPFVIDDIEKNSPDGFVIFSPQMAQYAEAKGATGPNQLDNLQKAMLASGRFKIWHRDGDVVIYRLIPQAK